MTGDFPMAGFMRRLNKFLERFPHTALVEVTDVKGSTPRDPGAWMLVAPDATLGTIGGGQLEFLAINKARELIKSNVSHGAMDIPLGPEIGQCCGGRVAIDIRMADEKERTALRKRLDDEISRRKHVYLFGAGHVGKALAASLSHLPLRVFLVDNRVEAMEDLPEDVDTILTAIPEAAVRDAPPHSAFVILTHDHALDFLITKEALARSDAAYVGMIGSKTKKATFRSWLLKEGGRQDDFDRLISPIGGHNVRDKRPEVIAALTTAEIARAMFHEAG